MAMVALGKQTVVTAGVPIQVNAGTSMECNSIYFEQIASNGGSMYIMDRSTGVKATFVGVCKVLLAPTSTSLPSFTVGVPASQNSLNVSDYWVDADTSGNGILVTALVL